MAETNQQIIVSDEVDLDDRLDIFVDEMIGEDSKEESEPEQEVDEVVDEEGKEEDESSDEDSDEETEPEYVELKHNGKTVKLTLDEVLEHASKGFDYTAKTQELADTRKAIEAQAHLLQQNYQLQQETMQQTAQLYALDNALGQYQQVNWDGWMDQDPIEATKGWQKFQMLKANRDEVANSINQTRTQAQIRTQQEMQKMLAEGNEVLSREIKNWSPELARSLLNNGMEYGFSESELSQVVDPRMVKVLHDAYQWRQLQSKKPEVQKRVNQAPKSSKPNGKVDTPESNRKTLLNQLKSTRDVGKREKIANSLLDKYV